MRVDAQLAVLHGQGPVWEKGQLGRMDCLNILIDVLQTRGHGTLWRAMADDTQRFIDENQGAVHIILDDRPLVGPRIVYCLPSYLNGFWYFDRQGSRNNSSLQTRLFRPEGMSDVFARQFAKGLRAKFVAEGRSKFQQSEQPQAQLKPDAICIFTQDFRPPKFYTHFATYPDLINSVLDCREGRPVYIKPHPKQPLDDRLKLMQYHAPDHGVEVVPYSIHALLEQASVAISLSSAVLVEAQMHHVPGIVAGQVDFHHNMVPLKTLKNMQVALHKAASGVFEYDKFLTFFFAQNMVQPRLRKKAADRMNTILDQIIVH